MSVFYLHSHPEPNLFSEANPDIFIKIKPSPITSHLILALKERAAGNKSYCCISKSCAHLVMKQKETQWNSREERTGLTSSETHISKNIGTAGTRERTSHPAF